MTRTGSRGSGSVATCSIAITANARIIVVGTVINCLNLCFVVGISTGWTFPSSRHW